MKIEFNLKTIQALINALVIASATTQQRYSQDQINARLSINEQAGPVYLESQATLIDTIEEYEKLLSQFRELETRARIELGES